jgi:hypothetical protein
MEGHANSDTKQPAGVQSPPADHQDPEMIPDDLEELRDRKNREYLRAALNMENPLAAGIGVLNGDLMIFANHMQRTIMPALRTSSTEPGALAKVMPVMEAYGRVARQVERLATLTDRLNRQQEAANKAAAKMRANEAGTETASA